MKTTHLLNTEFKNPLNTYQEALNQLARAKDLSVKMNRMAAQLDEAGLSAGPPPIALDLSQPKEQFQQVFGEIPPLLDEVAKEAAMIKTLENEISSAEQALLQARNRERASLIKRIIFIAIGLIILFIILNW